MLNPDNAEVLKQEPPASTKIPPASEPPPPRELVFSFKYLQENHKRFDYKKLPIKHFKKLLGKFRLLSEKNYQHWLTSGHHRYHPIKDSKKDIFKSLPSDLLTQPAFQFEVADKVRVYGITNEAVFWVVFIDPNHDLY